MQSNIAHPVVPEIPTPLGSRWRGQPRSARCLLAWLWVLISIVAADAQVYEKLFSFTDANSTAPASNLNRGSLAECALVEGGDGNFYGTTPEGGSSNFGTVFRMAPDGVLTTLVQFGSSGKPNDGKKPRSGLVLGLDGNFYGTTSAGGVSDCGTVFKVTPGGVLTVLMSFTGSSGVSKGKDPVGILLLDGSGNFHGTTRSGGAADQGTVFRVTPAGAVTTLVEFSGLGGPAKGSSPSAGLLRGSDGNFYGTTETGGVNDCGTAFKMTPAGGLTTLAEFTAANSKPRAELLQGGDGNFYGTTRNGGIDNNGTIFKMTAGGALTTLVELAEVNCFPYAGMIEGGDGNFYGTTRGDTVRNIAGTVFRMTPGGEFTTMVEFTDLSGPNKGSWPSAKLVRGSDGSFYATTSLGGANGWGTVFKVTLSGTLTTLVEFDGSGTTNKGTEPTAGLLQAADGNFYGTTKEGGAYGWGTIFRMTPAGELTTLVSFTLNESANKGGYPYSGVILGSDGNFYGTTAVGGNSVAGTIFKMTPAGELTTLVQFTAGADGGLPVAGLVQAGDGNFYGTTNALGPNGCGTVFRMTPGGEFTTLLAFTGTSGPNLGRSSTSALIQGGDGLLYGTTLQGGASDLGTVFKMTTAGVLTTLVEFTGMGGAAKGAAPTASLVLGDDGQYYGTTNDGGVSNGGTVFKMTSGGVLTTLHEFNYFDGSSPADRLVKGADGKLYGTTTGNTIFTISPGGVLSNIFNLSFDPVDRFLTSHVTFGSDGNLYAVTQGDKQAGGAGSIFRLVYPGKPTVFPFKTHVSGQTSAVIQAKVNARGAATTTVIEYGTDGVTFPHTLSGIPGAVGGFQSVLVGGTLTGLTAGTTYHCRFRATSGAGTTVSPVISFITLREPTAVPAPPTQVQQTSARFNGMVNAQNFGTSVVFEYGSDGNTFPHTVAASPGMINGAADAPVTSAVAGLTKGSTYYYRLVATNIAGTTVTGSVAFRTLTEPTAQVAGVVPLSTTSARVGGTLNAQGSATQIVFEYGTDGISFPNSVAAVPPVADGEEDNPVSAELTNLAQGATYYYRVKGTSAGGVGTSSPASFQMATLSGLSRVAPAAAPEAEGFLLVNLSPIAFPNTTLPPGWRFVGEQLWRSSGIPVGGLSTGNRDIEYRPIPGYIQPARETIGVVSGAAATVVAGEYFEAAGGSVVGGLTVTLKPVELADIAVPAAERAQWRLLGEDDSKWRDSGDTLANQLPGDYLLECKPVAGRATPPAVSVAVTAGKTAVATVTYLLASATSGAQPAMLSFDTVTGSPALPYAYAGQIRSQLGSSSGFVVKPRVVATAAHVVFDDGTLSYVGGLQWLFERDRGVFEPVPQTPRGFYVSGGYKEQRTADASPGVSSPAAQNLDSAALYFVEDAGRGGFGGFLASDLPNNEFLLSPKLKLLVGYPVDGIAAPRQGRMHATVPANVGFAKAYGQTYVTADIRSSGGASGGPLCVQHDNGNYYPAAIYLGGSGQTVVRAIDSSVIDLFTRAEVSANGGDNNTGGGITHSSLTAIGATTNPGAIKITILPEVAAQAGGGWRLSPETSYRASDARKGGLKAGTYIVQFRPLPGYQAPTQQTLEVPGGTERTITYTYESTLTALQSWRFTHFGTTEDTGPAADSADPDGDTKTNLDEYAAGTDPNNITDFFRVLTFAKTAVGFTVTAAGKAGRNYLLERTTALGTGPWTEVTTSGLLAADGLVTLTDAEVLPGSGFYRMRVTAP